MCVPRRAADYVVVVGKGGEIVEHGAAAEMRDDAARAPALHALLGALRSDEDGDDDEEEDEVEDEGAAEGAAADVAAAAAAAAVSPKGRASADGAPKKKRSSGDAAPQKGKEAAAPAKPHTLVKEEDRGSGALKASMYRSDSSGDRHPDVVCATHHMSSLDRRACTEATCARRASSGSRPSSCSTRSRTL